MGKYVITKRDKEKQADTECINVKQEKANHEITSRTVKEDIQMIRRGIQEFDKILPGQMAYLFCKSALAGGGPWLAIWMSAAILNELAGAGDKYRLGLFVLASAGGTLLLSVLGHWLGAKMEVGYSRLFSTHEVILTDKAFRLPFFELERECTRKLREQVSGSMDLSGGGMASLYWDMEVFADNLCRAAVAMLSVLPFLYQVTAGVRDGRITGREALGILLLLSALTIWGTFFTCKTAARRFAVSFDVFEHGAEYNRYGEFYDLSYLPDEDMAMDIRIFRQKELVIRESQEKCYRRLADGKVREMRAVSRMDAARLLSEGVCGAAVYGAVGFLAVRQVIGIGNVVMVSAAVSMLIAACSRLAEIITDLRNNNVHLQNYFEYMDLEEESGAQSEFAGKREVEVKAGTAAQGESVGRAEIMVQRGAAGKAEWAGRIGGIKSAGAEGVTISFEGVSFRYPESETMVLHDISLTIAPGEKLAIVGENGSGKTTLIKLLCRLYQPTEGRILLNGQDIRSLPYEEYIRNIATVFQDFAIFAFSIAENVAASAEYDGQRVWAALSRAGLQGRTEGLSKGILQAVSHDYEEDGINLSGGEAQKLAIARASYKDAPVVILDEPTAALDPYAEKEVYEQFFRNLAGETMLSISHRLSSCRFCDRIAVLQKGRLVQLGTHADLLARPEGKYAEMWKAQAQYYGQG
ncbi:MAG: ABC transporter ATP-binding protein [Lachnospiraceae bacterium]|jgi:ATP-binding cassette subfamily B protein|nr:ABC transporter ATP-binding protein [Lachnospiraceae bacterium]